MNFPPPKAPCPEFGKATHHSIELVWKGYLDKLKEVFPVKNSGRILVEAQFKASSKDNWESIYSGYDSTTVVKNLEPATNYDFRIRFKNKNGFGEFSDAATIMSSLAPLNGENLHRAVRLGDAQELENILMEQTASIEATDAFGFTPLMVAAQKDNLGILNMLLLHRANPNNQQVSGKTALMLAAYRNHVDCMEALLANEADYLLQDKGGLSAISYAVDGESLLALRCLLNNGADVNARDGTYWTPLLRCAGMKTNGSPIIAYELLRYGADVNAQDHDGKTALHNAVLNNHVKLCEVLLEHGADIDVKTHSGSDAISMTHVKALKELLGQHAMKNKVKHP